MKYRLARLLASGFGAGFFPIAPGTAGSAVALILGAAMLQASEALLVAAILVVCAGGIWAVRETETEADPGWVVIDEFAGQWIAMLGMQTIGWKDLLAAFVLFRLFDICKPRPVAWADQRKDALGVMADDMIAGTMAALALAVIHWRLPGLLD
jgi:phosphatidylglycerophosphatase A